MGCGQSSARTKFDETLVSSNDTLPSSRPSSKPNQPAMVQDTDDATKADAANNIDSLEDPFGAGKPLNLKAHVQEKRKRNTLTAGEGSMQRSMQRSLTQRESSILEDTTPFPRSGSSPISHADEMINRILGNGEVIVPIEKLELPVFNILPLENPFENVMQTPPEGMEEEVVFTKTQE
jgi:hypothetical protein